LRYGFCLPLRLSTKYGLARHAKGERRSYLDNYQA
jgi:hypothetical protein